MGKETIKCKACGCYFDANETSCPECGAKKIIKIPFYKKLSFWFFTIIMVLVVVVGISAKRTATIFKSITDERKNANSVSSPINEKSDEAVDPNMTESQKNAYIKAKTYIGYSAFSHDGLVKQLEYEKFSHDDSVFAVEQCNIDWDEQAVKSAKSYLNTSSFSHDELVEQLEYEGFSHEQAILGVESNGLK